MTPEEYLVRNIYRNATKLLSTNTITFTDATSLASLFVLGMRTGIALHFQRPETAEIVLQAIRERTNTIEPNANYDTDIRMIEMILGADIWKSPTPIPTAN